MFSDKKAIFNPPYDSPIEEAFMWNIVKYINPKIEIIPQYEISTAHGCFRLDFAIKIGVKLIGIECDGKEYHKISRDIWRDVIIMENSNIVDIFRFRGCDLIYSIAECLVVLSWYYPNLFDQRGISNLMQLVDYEFANDTFYKEHPMSMIDIEYKQDDEVKRLIIYRNNKKIYNYKQIAEISKKQSALKLDALFEKYNNLNLSQ